MHPPEDVMKPDLFSEVLLGSGGIVFIAPMLVVVTALTRG